MKSKENYPIFRNQSAHGQKLYYFGPWSDPDVTEAKYLQDREYLQAGLKPPQVSNSCLLQERVNRFLTVIESMRNSGELSLPRSFPNDFNAYERIIEHFRS